MYPVLLVKDLKDILLKCVTKLVLFITTLFYYEVEEREESNVDLFYRHDCTLDNWVNDLLTLLCIHTISL